MLVVVGVIVLVAAVVLGVAGVVTNAGRLHLVTDNFAILGYHITGSTGTILMYGMLIGIAGMLGLSMVLAGARRAAVRGQAARRELKQFREAPHGHPADHQKASPSDARGPHDDRGIETDDLTSDGSALTPRRRRWSLRRSREPETRSE